MNSIAISLFFFFCNYTFCSSLPDSDFKQSPPQTGLTGLVLSASRAIGIRYSLTTQLNVFGLSNENLDNRITICEEEQKTKKNKEFMTGMHITNSEEFNKKKMSIDATILETAEKEFYHRIQLYAKITLAIMKQQESNGLGDTKSGYTVLRIEKMLEHWSEIYGTKFLNEALQNHLEFTQTQLKSLQKNVPAEEKKTAD